MMKCRSESSFAKLMSIGNQLRRSSSISYLPELLQGLNSTQMAAISYIFDHEADGVFQKDIESFLRIRRSSVSTLLNNLEKSGLIARIPVPEDARLKQVTLTDEGRVTCRVIEEFNVEIEQFMKRVLTAREMESLARILEKLMSHIDSFQAERSARHRLAEWNRQ